MSRIRTVKPDFFVDEDVAQLGPLARLLFVGMWTLADREGRLENRPLRIKAQVLPYDDVDINMLIGELAASRLIVRYERGGKRLIQIRSFSRHQRPHPKEPASEYDPPTTEEVEGVKSPELLTAVERNGEDVPSREKKRQDNTQPRKDLILPGGSGKGREGKEDSSEAIASPSEPSSPAVLEFPTVGRPGQPKAWGLTEAFLAELRDAFPGVDCLGECKKARLYVTANPTHRKTAVGMPSFLSRWMSRAQNGPPRAPNLGQRSPPELEAHAAVAAMNARISARYGGQSE